MPTYEVILKSKDVTIDRLDDPEYNVKWVKAPSVGSVERYYLDNFSEIHEMPNFNPRRVDVNLY